MKSSSAPCGSVGVPRCSIPAVSRAAGGVVRVGLHVFGICRRSIRGCHAAVPIIISAATRYRCRGKVSSRISGC